MLCYFETLSIVYDANTIFPFPLPSSLFFQNNESLDVEYYGSDGESVAAADSIVSGYEDEEYGGSDGDNKSYIDDDGDGGDDGDYLEVVDATHDNEKDDGGGSGAGTGAGARGGRGRSGSGSVYPAYTETKVLLTFHYLPPQPIHFNLL